MTSNSSTNYLLIPIIIPIIFSKSGQKFKIILSNLISPAPLLQSFYISYKPIIAGFIFLNNLSIHPLTHLS